MPMQLHADVMAPQQRPSFLLQHSMPVGCDIHFGAVLQKRKRSWDNFVTF